MQVDIQEKEKELFLHIQEVAKQLNTEAFVIGGFVRDKLLNRESKDLDIVCLGSGIDLAQELARKAGIEHRVTVYKNFGTAMLHYGDFELEFVGARKESYRRDSRKPIVEDGSLEDDQNRRDFTVNALALSLREEDFGELIDPFGGLADLEKKILRTPLEPSITYSDDPLRMMRAIRFASQLGFEIEEQSLAAIKQEAERIGIVSQERITVELEKIMACNKPSIGFSLLFDTGLLKYILPELQAMQGIEYHKGQGHKDNFYHTLEVVDNLCALSDNIWLRWAALFHDIAKPLTKRFVEVQGWTFHGHEALGAKLIPKIFKRLRLPLDSKMRFVQKIVGMHQRPILLTKEEKSDSALRRLLFDAGNDIEELLTLCRADSTSKNMRKRELYLKNLGELEQELQALEERDKLRNWQPPISGELIMETFAIKPSAQVGLIKNAIREAILDGIIPNDYDAAYLFMLEKGKAIGLLLAKKD